MKYTTDKSGKVINSEVINPGSRGDDLQLTIDIDLQKSRIFIRKSNQDVTQSRC